MVMFFVVLVIGISGVFFSTACVDSQENQNKMRRNYIIFVSIVLILQSGLRNIAIGADTYNYSLAFENICKYWTWNDVWRNFITVYLQNEGKDAGYVLLQKSFQIFLGSYRLFLVAIALFFFWALGKVIYRNTTSIANVIFAYILYLSLFYSFFSITGHRQTIATAIILFGFGYVQNKKIIGFLLCCIAAFFLHKSSLLLAVIYPLYWFRKTKLLYWVSLVAVILTILFRTQIINYIYIIYYDEFRAGGLMNYPFTFIGFMITCFLIVWLHMEQLKKNGNDITLKLANVIVIGFILSPTIGADSVSMRIVQYFSLFLMLLLPKIFDMYKSDRIAIYLISIILLLFVLFSRTNQYAFYWQPMQKVLKSGNSIIIQE